MSEQRSKKPIQKGREGQQHRWWLPAVLDQFDGNAWKAYVVTLVVLAWVAVALATSLW